MGRQNVQFINQIEKLHSTSSSLKLIMLDPLKSIDALQVGKLIEKHNTVYVSGLDMSLTKTFNSKSC